MNKTVIGIVIVVLILLGVGFWYFNNRAKAPSPTGTVETTAPTSSTSDSSPSASAGSVVTLNVQSSGLNFTPNQLKVKKGDKVKLIYTNNMGTHDFTLDEYNIKTKLLGAGQSETVEFVADKAGSFEYYCSVPGHRQAGMKGTLVVE